MQSIDSIEPLENPKFIKPILINYTQDNVQKTWEAIESNDSVCVLLWHKDKNAFVLVKQLRATVFNATKEDGCMYELCAGLVDKDMSEVRIAQEEVLEECGYKIDIKSFSKISTYYTSVGISGAKQSMFFAVCSDAQKVSDGGGIDDEKIEVIYVPVEESRSFMFNQKIKKTPSMIMAFYWYYDNICPIP